MSRDRRHLPNLRKLRNPRRPRRRRRKKRRCPRKTVKQTLRMRLDAMKNVKHHCACGSVWETDHIITVMFFPGIGNRRRRQEGRRGITLLTSHLLPALPVPLFLYNSGEYFYLLFSKGRFFSSLIVETHFLWKKRNIWKWSHRIQHFYIGQKKLPSP